MSKSQRPDHAQHYVDFSWFKPVFLGSCFSQYLYPIPSCLTSTETLFPQWWGLLSLLSRNQDLVLCVPWCLGPSLSYLTNTRLSSSDEGHHGLPLISEATSSPRQEGVTLWIKKTNKTYYINTFPFGSSGIEEKSVSFSSSRLSPQVTKETVIKGKVGPLRFREAGLWQNSHWQSPSTIPWE